jgi:2-iminobutanoate/2-iminopropanoate deaminase
MKMLGWAGDWAAAKQAAAHAAGAIMFLGALGSLAACGGDGRLEPQAASDGAIRIDTPAAPEAIGPYSQAVLAGNTLYLAGQIALDPESGVMVQPGPDETAIEVETRRVLDNLGAVLAAAGFGFEHVVQAQVFLVDLAEFGAMNAIYETYFEGMIPPARATVQVAALPRGARVEILFTAVRP